MDDAILHGELNVGDILNIFACSITEWESDSYSSSEADKANDNKSVVTIEAAEAKANPGKAKQASVETAAARTLATIADDCDNVLAFLQAIAVKSPRVIVAPLSLLADKHARIWSQQWTDVNLPKPPTLSPQDHLGLTGVRTNVATRLHTAEALRPVVAAQPKAEKETKGWDCLPPKAQRVILVASATTGTSISTSLPPTIHCFLNAINVTALQDDCLLTYAGNNIYLPTSFCQALLQGHILAIPDPDALMYLSFP